MFFAKNLFRRLAVQIHQAFGFNAYNQMRRRFVYPTGMALQIQYEHCFALPGYKAVSLNPRQEVRRPIMLVDFPFNFAS
jgi:hypothetical protein